MQVPQIPREYDPKAMTTIIKGLIREIEDLKSQLSVKEAKSILNEAAGSFKEDVLHLVKDTNGINVDLALRHNGRIHTWSSNTEGSVASTGGQAPADAQYVVSSADAALPNADVLTGTSNQVIVTPGTNINTLSLPQSIHTAATPQFARLGLGAAAHASLSINATNGAAIDGAVTINDTGNAVDLRVESDGDVNALFVHGTNNTVQVGAATASDSAKFYVSGKISTSGEMEINGDLNHDGTNVGFYGVAPTPRPSAYTISNGSSDRAYDANATSTDELADVLFTVISDLQAVGLLQ